MAILRWHSATVDSLNLVAAFRTTKRRGIYYRIVDHLRYTFHPGDRFLGELLEVESGQPSSQEEHALAALARHTSDRAVGASLKTVSCCNRRLMGLVVTVPIRG